MGHVSLNRLKIYAKVHKSYISNLSRDTNLEILRHMGYSKAVQTERWAIVKDPTDVEKLQKMVKKKKMSLLQ